MEIISAKRFFATLTIGLRMGYTTEPIPIAAVYDELRRLQDQLIKEKQLYLSANCYESTIVLLGHREPHLNIKFINYPRFPIEEDIFKTEVKSLAGQLMKCLNQNRVLIEFDSEIIMIQESEWVDGRIGRG